MSIMRSKVFLYFTVFFLCFGCLSLFVPLLVYGYTEYEIDAMSPVPIAGNVNEVIGTAFNDNSSGTSSNTAGLMQSFKSSTGDRYLSRACFFIHSHGSPIGHVYSRLINLTTSETIVQSSNYFEAGGGLDGSLCNFTFPETLIKSDVWYGIALVVLDVVQLNTNNYLHVPADTTSGDPNAQGGMYRLQGGGWAGVDLGDVHFYVFGYDEPAATPSPSPVPAVTQNVVPSEPFVAVPSYYMVLLVLFAVVAVLAGLYVTFEREQENKGVALLFVLVGLVLFVILIVGYLVGF